MTPVVEQLRLRGEAGAAGCRCPHPPRKRCRLCRRSRTPAAEKMTPVETPKAAAPSEAKPAAAMETPKPAAPKKAAAAAVEAPKKAEAPAASVEARRDSDGLRVTFSFAAPTPAAMFRRADTVWLVFDQTGPIDVEQIRAKGGAIIGDVSRLPLEKGQAIRIRLNRPQMPSLESDGRANGMSWTLTFADRVQAPPLPLQVLRNITDPALANVTVPLANPGLMHRLVDPDAGDTLLVVTAPPPTRGFIKRQDFVELSLLESVHGVVVHPEFRRHHRRGRIRQGDARPAGRADAVVGRRLCRTRHRRGAAAV